MAEQIAPSFRLREHRKRAALHKTPHAMVVRRSTAACFFLRVFVRVMPTAPDYKEAASCASASACASFALARSSPFDFDFVATFFSTFSSFTSGFGSAAAT